MRLDVLLEGEEKKSELVCLYKRNEGYREGEMGGEDSHLFLHQRDGKQSLETCRPSKDIVYKTPLFRGKKKTVV